MSTERDQHDKDDALEKILAALRDAAPPEGMEARIAQRLERSAATVPAARFDWRGMLAGSTFAGAWWRGAAIGAAAATLAITGMIMVRPGSRVMPEYGQAAERGGNQIRGVTSVSTSSQNASAIAVPARPCTHSTMLRAQTIVPAAAGSSLLAETRAESNAPSHPAPELPLTTQERALIRLVQNAKPRHLAIINPEEYANLEAQSALKFEKFFAPPAPPPAPDTNAATTSAATPESNSVDKPEIVEENPSQTKEEE